MVSEREQRQYLPDAARRAAARHAYKARQRHAEEQAALHADSAAVLTWGQAHPDAFGGMWFSNPESADGGPVMLTVAVTDGTDDRALAELRAGLEHSDRIQVVPVAHSLRRLEALAHDVRERHMPVRALQAPTVLSLSVDARANAVELGLANPLGEEARALERELAGQPVRLVAAPSAVPLGHANR